MYCQAVMNGNLVAAGFSDGYIRIIDYTTAAISVTLHRHIYSTTVKAPSSIVILPTTPYLIASAGADYYVRISWQNGTNKVNYYSGSTTIYPLKLWLVHFKILKYLFIFLL